MWKNYYKKGETVSAIILVNVHSRFLWKMEDKLCINSINNRYWDFLETLKITNFLKIRQFKFKNV